ncbi:hypothetical protein [Tenacibaculum finnmarkense]|uniref:Uncharacterized protein n=2 Tax=Tenacibaculum finnmarkense TaxID=2781243 RepID=A0A2I2LDS0_9FLAO|nr:hypothetical protein [Tenacibaculum finnmarkense]MBE7645422.1 hypothetical protein [Tenacibaculum finnmarkense genomovar ulcerans]MBE7647750.1 hypothetical protein [Tenacibaculum finnmarkense genomovar ulcerans]MBE7652491.1 hypothetical protein [Tenacibaculum finnmarkense genomovar finnmarkense]MBE7694699.1 hypothetical protein [Tenacibaculum finnmarkense genomovar finnmarkense]MBE7697603.1 hypothetical protein [Tenacibaculum finnmarkense genomovar ulcerans]
MNLKYIIIALVFFLIPEVSESLLLGNFIPCNTTENLSNKWLEEETELESVSALSEKKTIESGNSSGGANTVFIKPKNPFIFHDYYIPLFIDFEFCVFTPKNAKYIEYCSLKIPC